MTPKADDRRVQKLLFDAAVEIAARVGTDNSVFGDLFAELQKQSQPLSTSIREIAQFYDIPPADALNEVVKTGCRLYWWNGTPYEANGIQREIKEFWQWDITPEVDVDLSPDQRRRLDDALGEEREEIPASENAGPEAAQVAPRRFVASEPSLPSREEFGKKLG